MIIVIMFAPLKNNDYFSLIKLFQPCRKLIERFIIIY